MRTQKIEQKHMLKNPNIVIFLKKIRSVTCMLKNTDSISLLKMRFYSFSFLGCFTTFAHVKINAPSAFGTPPPED